MDRRCDDTPAAETQRAALREAIAFKVYEFDAHGVEMNHRYESSAVATDGQSEPAFTQDSELHFEQTTWPGARLPHAWLFGDGNKKASTLDLCGHGRFTILTSIGDKAWVDAAEALAAELGLPIATHVIGPRQQWQDHYGDWARAREVGDAGVILVRPDHHVAWRSEGLAADPAGELRRVLKTILDR